MSCGLYLRGNHQTKHGQHCRKGGGDSRPPRQQHRTPEEHVGARASVDEQAAHNGADKVPYGPACEHPRALVQRAFGALGDGEEGGTKRGQRKADSEESETVSEGGDGGGRRGGCSGAHADIRGHSRVVTAAAFEEDSETHTIILLGLSAEISQLRLGRPELVVLDQVHVSQGLRTKSHRRAIRNQFYGFQFQYALVSRAERLA